MRKSTRKLERSKMTSLLENYPLRISVENQERLQYDLNHFQIYLRISLKFLLDTTR